MWINVFFRIASLVILASLMLACENPIDNRAKHSGISVDTNAYYAAYQKGNEGDWQIIHSENTLFELKTVTFAVSENKEAYGMVFVCPSQEEGSPNEVYVYYGTAEEMSLIDFNCKKSLGDVGKKAIYGSVKGVTIADLANPQGELVRLAMLDQTLDVWEAYALTVRSGKRDIIALKGRQSGNDLEPDSILIRRNMNVPATAEPLSEILDFDNASSSTFVKRFSESDRSTVNISGNAEGNKLQASVSFISKNATTIRLQSSAKDKFTFLPVPLLEYTGDGAKTNRSEFNPGEGHGLSVIAVSEDGVERSKAIKFFTTSEGLTHNLHLLKPITRSPQLSAKSVDDSQSVILKWNRYQDDVSGEASFYQWLIKGTAADFLTDKAPTVKASRVVWHVAVTSGWLAAVGASGEIFTLVLPAHFELGAYDGAITVDSDWRHEWGFKAGTVLSWEMSAITANEKSTVEDVVDYLSNGKFGKDLAFSEVKVNSTLSK